MERSLLRRCFVNARYHGPPVPLSPTWPLPTPLRSCSPQSSSHAESPSSRGGNAAPTSRLNSRGETSSSFQGGGPGGAGEGKGPGWTRRGAAVADEEKGRLPSYLLRDLLERKNATEAGQKASGGGEPRGGLDLEDFARR